MLFDSIKCILVSDPRISNLETETMKAVILTLLLATSVTAEDATSLKVHIESTGKHQVEERNQKALAKKQNMFYSMAHMKSTPWDAQPQEREAKCQDMCKLNDFWEFQEQRNCFSRPTDLCSVYKTGIASMDVVLTVAECACSNSSDA
ncbi:hypothetical protein PsorP6_017732 [Peronosclerospora sorghi]|uniref:Uncharacterized protein n=1 Tax=Peronosclerospora sorghi TaxID=230839 RepID=A0ACC0WM01_9STRA|nr:hypothetical protein PsorP6_017732 [Peronosclerospora sorghi]